jgi:hypothetical protein
MDTWIRKILVGQKFHFKRSSLLEGKEVHHGCIPVYRKKQPVKMLLTAVDDYQVFGILSNLGRGVQQYVQLINEFLLLLASLTIHLCLI